MTLTDVRRFVSPSGETHILAVSDLTRSGGVLQGMVPEGADVVVYSDPPWSPGNEKWWRRYAGESEPRAYDDLLDGWVASVVSVCPSDVFVEQSANEEHRALLKAAIERCAGWLLPLREEWTVYYGSPRRPNVLMHYGVQRAEMDPSGLHGEAVTREVFDRLNLSRGQWIVDPCTGLGMSSRMAHRAVCNFAGTELNPRRLERTIGWLLKHGYREEK